MISDQQRATIRNLTSLAFVVLHALAAAFAVHSLTRTDLYDALLRLGIQTSSWHRFLLYWAIPVGVILFLLVGIRALWELGKAAQKWRRGEPEPDALLRARVLLYVALTCIVVNACFLSTPEKLSGPFRLRSPILASITTVIAYGVFILWNSMLPRLRRVMPAPGRRSFDLIAMNIALTLILAEVALGVTAKYVAAPLLVTESMPSQVRRSASRQPPGTNWFGFPINSNGHYDIDVDSKSDVSSKLVVSIGDSFSYGVVPHAYHFTTVAERELPGVEIYNMGFSGIGPTDYRYLLKTEALPLKPDLIVIQIYVGNDITEGPALAGPPRWYDGDSYLTAICWHRLRIMQRAKLNHADNVNPTGKSSAGALISYPFLSNPLLERPSLDEDVYFLLQTTQAEAICLPHPGLFERFFDSIIEIVRTAGDIPLKFVLIPDEFQVEDNVWDEVLRTSGKPLQRDLAQRKIIPWLEARRLAVLDLLPLLRAVKPMHDGQRHLYHARNLHFNARGNAVAGRALAKFVEGKEPQPEPLVATLQAVPVGEAVKMIQDYTDLLQQVGVNGSVVVDSSLLDFPKQQIMAAIESLVSVVADPAEKKSYVDVAQSLAFFQPDVGEIPTSLDKTSPNGETWRSIVVAEMQSIQVTLNYSQQ